jgi:hypothetical protein
VTPPSDFFHRIAAHCGGVDAAAIPIVDWKRYVIPVTISFVFSFVFLRWYFFHCIAAHCGGVDSDRRLETVGSVVVLLLRLLLRRSFAFFALCALRSHDQSAPSHTDCRLFDDVTSVHVASAVSQYVRDVVTALRHHCLIAIGPSSQAAVALAHNARTHALLSGVKFLRPR